MINLTNQLEVFEEIKQASDLKLLRIIKLCQEELKRRRDASL